MTRTRTVALTAVPPLAAAAISIAVLLNLDLPAQIAVHWGFDGVNGVANLGDLIAPIAIFVPLTTALMVGTLVFGTRAATSPLFGRFVVATSSILGIGIALTPLAIALAQVDVADVESVSVNRVAAYVGLAFVVAVVIAVILLLVTPKTPTVRSTAADAPELPLGENERASWSRSVGPSPIALVILGAAVVIVIVTLAIAGAPLALTLIIAVVLAAVTGLLFWRVTIDARGITVHSALAVPRFHIDPAGVVAARAISVDPLRQFGGWGIRVGAAGWGVVVRSGTAIEVERDGKSPFIVTVDDAVTGAALLTAIARRNRA